MKKIVGFIACLLGFACVVFAGVLAAVHIVGTDAELYYQLQMKANVLDSAGISEEDLVKLDKVLAEYLGGNESVTYERMYTTDTNGVYRRTQATVFGQEQDAFNEKEWTHLEDCFNLFELLRDVLRLSLRYGISALLLGVVLLRDRKKVRLAAWISPLAVVVPLGILAFWAVFDFNAAFNFFHEILFTNDLWLLDARTDLLIRICPASMFMSMGVRIGLMAFAWAVFVPALATVFSIRKKERK